MRLPQNKPVSPSISAPALLWRSRRQPRGGVASGDAQSAAATEGALIRRPGQKPAAVPWASVLAHHPGWSPQPVAIPFATAGRNCAPKVWSYGNTAMCRVWPWTRFNGRVWVSEHGARAAMQLNLVEPAELTAGLWSPKPAKYSVRRSLRLKSAPGLVIHGGSGPRGCPLPVWAIGPWRSVSSWSGAICRRWAGLRAMCAGFSCRRWNGGV